MSFQPQDKSSSTSLSLKLKGKIFGGLLIAWHQHGTALAGNVVDPVDFSVFQATNLRVVDGSIWRESPSTNPQATNMMLGRLAGVKILDKRGQREGAADVTGAAASS
jgi:fatty acid omega-hydroxy dehydrogenase